MGWLERRNRKKAFAIGQQTAKVMHSSLLAVVAALPTEQMVGGQDELESGEACKRVLALRPHWRVTESGMVEFHGIPVSEWIGQGEPDPTLHVVTKIEADTTLAMLVLTVITAEFRKLFDTEAQLRVMLIPALEGAIDYITQQELPRSP